MSAKLNLIGLKFGKLTVIERAECKNARTYWRCKCECGNEKIVQGCNLKSGHTKSCGCTVIENPPRKSHGRAGTDIYKTWLHIKQRCYDEKTEQYKNYGGRGITVCDRWRDDFQAFYDDISKLPHFGEKGYSLDRIDNNGNYEPNNVRWATAKEQANNRRTNHLITYNGKTQTIAQWADETGINKYTIRTRLSRGWSAEKIFACAAYLNGGRKIRR